MSHVVSKFLTSVRAKQVDTTERGVEMSLTNKVVLITGAAGGMGQTHTQACLDLGANLVLTDVVEPQSLIDNDRVTFIKADVSSSQDWNALAKTIENQFGRLDGLVNNAGILTTHSLEETSEEEFDRVIAINQKGVFLGMHHCLPLLKKSSAASIVNISSTAGLVGIGECFAYSASKFAVRGMTKAAAIELAKMGIRVNSVHPGDTLTPMIEGLGDSAAVPDISHIPLGRFAQPEEISRAVTFLLSGASSYITGTEITVDGGYTAV